MRRHGKIDASQTEIVKKLRSLGYPTFSMADMGNGLPDIGTRLPRPCPKCGHKFNQTVLVELKEAGCDLTPKEIVWHDAHPGMAEVWVAIHQGKLLLIEHKGKLLPL